MTQKLNRRQFLGGLLLAAGGLAAGRCAPQSKGPTPGIPATAQPASPTDTPSPGSGPVQLTILHINDLHGALYASSKGDRELGGAAQWASMIAAERASASGPILFLDAGDATQHGLEKATSCCTDFHPSSPDRTPFAMAPSTVHRDQSAAPG